MQAKGQLSKVEITSALEKCIRRGVIEALTDGFYEPRKRICNAIRAGMADAFARLLESISVNDLLPAVEAGVDNRN